MKKKGSSGPTAGYLLSIMGLSLVLALCWQLPPKLLAWQDEKQTGTFHIQTAQSVAAEAPQGMALLEKVGLFHNGPTTILKVSGGKGCTSEKEAAGQAEKELRKLAEMGVLMEFGTEPLSAFSAETMFLIDREDSGRSMLVWYGSFETEEYLITWYMDDETGTLLGVMQLSRLLAKEWGDIGQYEFSEGIFGFGDNEEFPVKWDSEDERKAEQCGVKWAEYLGCDIQESGFAYDYQAMDQEWSGLVRSLMEDNGMIGPEAYFEAGNMMGYSWDYLTFLHYVTLTDGENRAVCFYNILPYGRCFWRFGDGTEIIW